MYPELKQAKRKNDWKAKAIEALPAGKILYGYCCGFFGRDSYEDKVIEKVFLSCYDGSLILRVSQSNGAHHSYCFSNSQEVLDLIVSSNRDCEGEENES